LPWLIPPQDEPSFAWQRVPSRLEKRLLILKEKWKDKKGGLLRMEHEDLEEPVMVVGMLINREREDSRERERERELEREKEKREEREKRERREKEERDERKREKREREYILLA
jgi:hypothetical protein